MNGMRKITSPNCEHNRPFSQRKPLEAHTVTYPLIIIIIIYFDGIFFLLCSFCCNIRSQLINSTCLDDFDLIVMHLRVSFNRYAFELDLNKISIFRPSRCQITDLHLRLLPHRVLHAIIKRQICRQNGIIIFN